MTPEYCCTKAVARYTGMFTGGAQDTIAKGDTVTGQPENDIEHGEMAAD